MSRQYYRTSQQIYQLFIEHPVMIGFIDEFEIDSDYDPSDPTSVLHVREVAEFLVSQDDLIHNTNLHELYDDDSFLTTLASKFGYTSPTYTPPWNQFESPKGTKLSELLKFTLYLYKFLSVDNFYEKHLLDFIPEHDREKILENDQLKLSLESMGRKLDDIEDKISRMTDIYDLDKTPEELLDYVGQNLGYEREDYTLKSLSFRELLKNIIEIYKVKGTNFSFSFFFKFLGFSISLKEFYYNRDVSNPESFPGVNEDRVEYFLTTQNPLFETLNADPAHHLEQIRNLDDWQLEIESLRSLGCTNPSQYMRGIESYNFDGVTFHQNPWKYFKTNLIEYELNPFFEKLNLTASDNETIRKYVRFLSPIYLFTWINVNLRPWIEDFNIIEDLNTQWSISITKTLGDPYPTPQPWPQFPAQTDGVPSNSSGVYQRKTSSDPGFEPPYLDYERVSDWIALYDPGSDSMTFSINNNLDLGGYDRIGTVLRRNGTHIRQTSHPKHISDARHAGLKRIAFDSIESAVKNTSDPDEDQYWIDYSFQSYPQIPNPLYPYNNRTVKDRSIITFDWENSPGAIQYWIQISRDEDFNKIVADVDTVSISQWTTPTSLINDTYYWRLKAKNDAVFPSSDPRRWTSWSIIQSFKLINLPFPKSGDVFDTDTTYVSSVYSSTGLFIEASIQFEWKHVRNASEYIVQIAGDSGFTGIAEEFTTGFTNYTVPLANGTYYWRLKANIRNSGWSSWSTTQSFTISFPQNI